MTELSDYKRLIEAPAIRSYEATIASLRSENNTLKAERETQSAEIERLTRDYQELRDLYDAKNIERDTLKAKLAKAEEVIKPFAEAAESLTGSEDDDAIIAPAFMDSPPLGECDLVVCCVADLRAAAQFTKGEEG